jgi:hypothetical protein
LNFAYSLFWGMFANYAEWNLAYADNMQNET